MKTVPVYIYDKPWLPYQDQIDWCDFCVLCPEKELPSLPDRLLSISNTWWNEARHITQDLFDRYFTMTGACRQIARMVQERWK